MAAPHVAGVAALVLSRQPAFSNSIVQLVLEGSADDLGAPAFDPFTGYGRVNAYQAVRRADEAARLPQLTITLQAAATAVAPHAPLLVTVAIGNSGLAPAARVTVDLYEGVPTMAEAPLAHWDLAEVLPGDTQTLHRYVVLEGLGLHTLSAVVDRDNTVKEIAERHNTATTNIEVATDRWVTRPVATGPSVQAAPAIADTRIVWQDDRNGNWDIYLYDLATGQERQMTTHPAAQIAPAIADTRIVWQDNRNGNWDIYLSDVATGEERLVTDHPDNQTNPAIAGHRIIWEDDRDFFHQHLYAYDLVTGQTSRVLSANDSDQIQPHLFGDGAVWADHRYQNWDVFFYDFTSGQAQPLALDPADQVNPQISGHRVAWMDTRAGNTDIVLYDLATGQERQLTTDPGEQRYPGLSGDRVVWQGARKGHYDIFLYDLTRNEQRQITMDPNQHFSPVIDGRRLAWEAIAGRDYDIHAAELDDFPGAPTQLVASRGSQVGTITLHWDDNVEPDLQHYTIYRSATSGGPYEPVGTSAAARYTDTISRVGGVPYGLALNTIYYYRVTAVDQTDGESGFSDEASALPRPGRLP